MPWELFLRALDCTRRVERKAWELCPPFVAISGGECTEHPEVVRFIEEVVGQGMWPILITNGMWLSNQELRTAILRPEWRHLNVQVTHDPRFYPSAPPPKVEDERITYVPTLTQLVPLGRAAGRFSLFTKGVPARGSPPSFNFRSITRHTGSIEETVAILRSRAAAGKSGHCTPSISANGDVVAGETNLCWRIGNVDNSNEELTQGALAMGSCNRCGLEGNLSPDHRRAIGLNPT